MNNINPFEEIADCEAAIDRIKDSQDKMLDMYNTSRSHADTQKDIKKLLAQSQQLIDQFNSLSAEYKKVSDCWTVQLFLGISIL